MVLIVGISRQEAEVGSPAADHRPDLAATVLISWPVSRRRPLTSVIRDICLVGMRLRQSEKHLASPGVSHDSSGRDLIDLRYVLLVAWDPAILAGLAEGVQKLRLSPTRCSSRSTT